MTAILTYAFLPCLRTFKRCAKIAETCTKPADRRDATEITKRVAWIGTGIFGLAAGCVAGYFAAAPTYHAIAKASSTYEHATTPDALEVEESISVNAKAGGGITATIVFTYVASQMQAVCMDVGGMAADSMSACASACWRGTKNAFSRCRESCPSLTCPTLKGRASEAKV